MIGLLTAPLARYALAAALVLGALAWAGSAVWTAGADSARAEFAAAQDAARAAHAAEVMRVADAASRAAAEALALRTANRRLADDLLAMQGRADVALDPDDVAGLRSILAAGGDDAAPGAAAR